MLDGHARSVRSEGRGRELRGAAEQTLAPWSAHRDMCARFCWDLTARAGVVMWDAVRSLQVGCGVRGRVDLWHGPMSRCRGGCCARWHVLDPTPLHIYTQLWRVRSVRCLLRAAGRLVCARDLHLCEMRAQSRTQLWRGPGGWRGARNRSQRAATRRRRERSVRPAAVRGGLRRGVVGEGDAEFPPDFYVAVRTMVRTLGTNSCELGNYFYEHYIQ